MHKPTIGWAGLGNMGTPMVKNLLRAGYPVTVYNRTPAKAQPVLDAGALSAPSPAALMEACEIVITMVSDDAAVKEIFEGAEGLLSRRHEGKLAIDMSSVSPATSRYLSQKCAAQGVTHLDAPVSGSVKPAEDAQLIIMAGGPAEAFEQAKPVFGWLGKKALHLGGPGMGNVAKLAINLLLGFNLQGMAETLLYAEDNGISPVDMLSIINEGGMGNGITKSKSAAVLDGNFPAAFAIKHYAKDLRLASDLGFRTPMVKLLHESYQQALQEGLGEEDVMAILKLLSRKKGEPHPE